MASVSTTVVKFDHKRACRDITFAKAKILDQGFTIYQDEFATALGESPELLLLHERANHKFAHEAGVYVKATHSVYFTGNFFSSDPIELFRIDCNTHEVQPLEYEYVTTRNANGACNYNGNILYCCQGSRTEPSALVAVDPATSESRVLIDNFYGREFNSINDVVIHHSTGDIWFTDPTYGWEQNFRPSPELPSQVYRFNPSTGQVWCVADGFVQCNGLCFSPNYARLYITDTGALQAHGSPFNGRNLSFNPRLPACIYSYDVVREISGEYSLQNRRMFAQCDNGVPDGIKCDSQGNVYSGCGDGIHVWNAAGTLIGKILVGGLVANFNFSNEGIWIFAEERLLLCKLKARGALVGIECS